MNSGASRLMRYSGDMETVGGDKCPIRELGLLYLGGSVDQRRLEIVCQRTGSVLVRNEVGVLSQAEGREPNAAVSPRTTLFARHGDRY